jgi:cysteine desulfurase
MDSDTICYLDHAAATPMDKRVVAAMQPFFSDRFFNPSSPYAPAVGVRHDYHDAKARLAATFGAKADEIIITAGATESINLAFASFEGHSVISAIEHDAVLAAAGTRSHTLIQPTEKGVIVPEMVAEAIQPDTQLVSVQLANNEIGTIQPVRLIAEVVKTIRQERLSNGDTTPLLLHSDGSQGFGQIDVHVARLGVDLLTLNAAKMYGPKQVGLLWAKAGIAIAPQILGGGQERGLRSGTENVAGVVGFAKAAELAELHRHAETKRLSKLRDDMEHKLRERFPDSIVSGHIKKRLPGSLHISFAGLDAERLIFRLETKGIYVATGSACAANKNTRSHVLEAIGLPSEMADGSLRLTFGKLSTDENCQRAATIIIEEVEQEYARIHGRA